LILSRLDPVSLKVQLGLLADLIEVNMSMADATTIRFRRTGSTAASQQVILKVQPAGTVDAPASFRHITFPAGSNRFDVGLHELLSGPSAERGKMVITVLGDGDTYRAGGDRMIEIAR
jgi:pyruvate/2-oxoacid:ferredoxin oxidoreductase beta subunit